MVESNSTQTDAVLTAEFGVDDQNNLLAALDQIEVAIASMLDKGEAGWQSLSLDRAREAYGRLEAVRNQMAAIDADFISAFDNDLPLKEHKRVQWLHRECRVSARDARERVQAFSVLCPPESASGGSSLYMPQFAGLAREGKAGQYTAAKVHRAVKSLPAKLQTEVAKAADGYIAALIEQGGPNAVDSLGLHLRKMIGQDEYNDDDRARLRSITVGKQGPDGMSSIRGKVSPRFAAALQRLFADHAKAGDLADRMCAAPNDGGSDGGTPFDPVTDPRSPEQRRHDALEAAVFGGFCRDDGESWSNRESGSTRNDVEAEAWNGDFSSTVPAISSRGLTPRRGSTTLVAVTTLQELMQQSGDAFTDGGIHCSLESLIGGVECTDFYLQILDLEEQTLHLGRSRRLGSLSQYLALLGEERISTAPGTSAPAAFCDIHHIRSWESGGETNLDNLTLVDRHVHSQTDDLRIRTDRWRSYSRTENQTSMTNNSRETNSSREASKVRWEPPDGHLSHRSQRKNLHPDAQPFRRRPGVA